ncbi:calcium/sodium antiporter [Acidobacteria bacterium AH-259-O06]|nr:calcium/sodium antiporter [Acidobacteria bacterium AH-259-O06]
MSEAFPAIVKVIGGLTLLGAGGELLVRGASRLATALRISPLVIGLTVVAFGTSAPELAVSLQSVFAGSPDIAIGNVVGSNIFNVLFILGLSALIVPLLVSSQLIRRDIPLMILASVLLYAFGRDGNIGRTDGSILFTALLIYVTWSVWQSRRESQSVVEELTQAMPAAQNGIRNLLLCGALIVVGLLPLTLGSRWLVDGSVTVATMLGISELIIGLTIVAVGTSLPEVATSIVAALRGERDIAVGNAVGSNLFNILCVVGLSSLIAPRGIAVSSTALAFDIPVMIAVAVACLPMFLTGHVIARWEGSLFFFYYLAYTAYLVLDATQSGLHRTLAGIMGLFVVPVTVVTLAVSVIRHVRKQE